jgi:ferrous iron transport protein B
LTASVPLVALVGNPNAGKSALFNALTGARQKIANYPGVTVERKSGRAALPDGRPVELIDLPGAYSLQPDSLDESVTRDVVLGQFEGQRRPDALVIVVDAGNLDNHLRFALELIGLGLPTVIALNMIDLARRDGLELDADRLQSELGVPVVPTVAVRKHGLDPLLETLGAQLAAPESARSVNPPLARGAITQRAHAIARTAIVSETAGRQWTRRLDSVLLHPLAGIIILLTLLFVMFQAVYAWSEAPIGWIEAGFAMLTEAVNANLPDGLLRSLIADGIIAGVGSVVVFLPQIVILFLFILLRWKQLGLYGARRLPDGPDDGGVGLSGRSFIPLLSSFACAIPGIMATRSDHRSKGPADDDPDRAADDLLGAAAGLCRDHRAFIPNRKRVGPDRLQGLVLFGSICSGIVARWWWRWCCAVR